MNNRKKSPKRMQGGDYMEPNKELTFGGPSNRVKAKKGRRRAVDGDTKKERSPLQRIADLPGQIIGRLNQGSEKLSETGARGADMMERERARFRNTSNTTSGRSNVGRPTSSSTKGTADYDAATASGNRPTTQRATSNTSSTRKTEQSTSGSSTQAKKDPYSEAKKRDSNLDSYIKQRNAATKGSLEYNEAQNKINKAYGKGPTDRITTYGPEKKGETAKAASTGKSAATAMASQSKTKPTLQTNMVSTSKPAAKPASEPTGRAKKIADRTEKKVGKIQDRRASAANRQSARDRKDTAAEAQKERGATKGMQRAAGRMAKANVKGNEAKASRAEDRFIAKSQRAKAAATSAEDKSANKAASRAGKDAQKAALDQAKQQKKADLRAARGKMEKGGYKKGRRKALVGSTVAGAGQVMKGVGTAIDAIAGRETTAGKAFNAGGDVVSTVGSVMGPDGQAVNAAGGALNNAAAGAVEKGITPDQRTALQTNLPSGGPNTAPATPTQGTPTAATNAAANNSVENAANQPMRRGGKRKMMGGKKMKYKAGGAKPDYLDMDKDGNKTEPMKSALKDRRSKAKKGRYKAQEGTITPEGARQKRYSYNKTKERQERNMSQARTKRMKEIAKAALTGNVGSMAAMAAKKMKNK